MRFRCKCECNYIHMYIYSCRVYICCSGFSYLCDPPTNNNFFMQKNRVLMPKLLLLILCNLCFCFFVLIIIYATFFCCSILLLFALVQIKRDSYALPPEASLSLSLHILGFVSVCIFYVRHYSLLFVIIIIVLLFFWFFFVWKGYISWKKSKWGGCKMSNAESTCK